MNLDTVRRVYEDWAPYYNPTHKWTLPKRRESRLALSVRPGDRILDLACGTGINFPHLRELVGERGEVIGFDLSPSMLAIAKKLIAKNGWNNVRVQEGDAAKLPFPNDHFDGVICNYALNIVPDYVHAISEIRRVLKPGRHFVSLEMRSGHSMPSWVAPICAVDLSHETLSEIQKTFEKTKVQYFWRGLIFLAIATKELSS